MNKYILILSIILSFSFVGKSHANLLDTKNIIIYWDASLSQKNKSLNKEFEFLDTFFKTFPNSTVKLIIFSTSIEFEGDFDVLSDNWNPIKQKLENVTYDGAANFSLINTKVERDILLLFSDGKSYLKDFKTSLYSPRIITISSQKDIDRKFLYETAFYNRGYYVNLLESNISESVKAIKEKKILPRLKFVSKKEANKNYIKGTVTDKNGILSGVTVTIAEKNVTTITEADGSYTIEAYPGDVLSFSHNLKQKTDIEIGNEKLIDIQMFEASNELETVFIKAQKSDNDFEEKVIIGDRIVNKRSLGYDVQSISADEIGDDERTLGSAMAGKFAGVQMGNNNNAGEMTVRGGFGSFIATNHPLFVIDGVPLPRSQTSGLTRGADMDFIDPNNIADITVLKGLAATNRYGSLGSSGVVIITTKSGQSKFVPKKEEQQQVIDYKIFNDDLVVEANPPLNYMIMLKSFTTMDEAYQHYLYLRPSKLDDADYFVACATYFFDAGSLDKGLQVLSNLTELFPQDTSVLKVLAFMLENYDFYDYAHQIYSRIIKVAPSVSQTYLDLANSYKDGKKSQQSIDTYKKIIGNKIEEVSSFDGLNSQISNDFKWLLSKRKQGWRIKDIDPKYFILPKFDLRVIVEWSHPQTSYELQYINPKKQYFNLAHTSEKNQETFLKELKEGYNSEEFILSETDKGTWYLNLLVSDKDKNDSKISRYLRIKVFTNFGRTNEKMTTHLINLDAIEKKIIFTSFKI